MRKIHEQPQRAEHLVEIVKAIAHPLRLRICSALCEGDACVNDLAKLLGARQATVSQQLRVMRMAGLVAAVRDGDGGRYTLAEPRLRALMDCLGSCVR